jgi:transmembrane sensor
MNMPRSPEAPAVLSARAEASAWITRLHGPSRSPELEAGFRRWLNERPENVQEFEGLTEVWDLVAGGAVARGAPRLERWERSAEAEELQALREHRRVRRSRVLRGWARAAVVLLVCGVVAVAVSRFWHSSSYSTEIGEQRMTQLADGTRVSLNSNSRLVVAFSDSQRRLKLARGEVFFDVAKDPLRPFVVVAGNHEVTALGTSFVVRYEADRTAVTLVDGKVAIARVGFAQDRQNSGAAAVTLNPGERLVIARSAASKVDHPRIEAVTAWRRGEVLLDDTPLADAVAEMNRYDATHILIDDPAIADLMVSGLYHTGDSEGFAQSVARMYQLRLIESEGRIHLRK